MTFYPLGASTPEVAHVALAPGESRAIENFLPSLFGIASGQGSLLITSDVPVCAAERIGSHTAQGDYGTFAAALKGSAGLERWLRGSRSACRKPPRSTAICSLYNRGLPGMITVTGFRADGTTVGPVLRSLGDHASGRLDSVFAALGVTDQAAGRIRVDVPVGMNVYGWTAQVDGYSGDLEIAALR